MKHSDGRLMARALHANRYVQLFVRGPLALVYCDHPSMLKGRPDAAMGAEDDLV